MIIINGRFLTKKITGVQRYAWELTNALDKIVQRNEVEIAIPPETKEIPNYKNIKVVRIGWFHDIVWEQIQFPLYVKKKNAISLNLCNTSPIIDPGIVCIHDMKIKKRPEDFSKKFLFWYNVLFSNACKKAKKIITVSDFSKSEIKKYYDVDAEKIVVIPNAWQHMNRINYDENTLQKYDLKKNSYYFVMSSIEPNKNLKWITEEAQANQKQIFAVAGHVNKKVFNDVMESDYPNNMKLLGYISDNETKTLMRDCKGFLFPSFYEGFGIPPLEALSVGAKLILVSDIDVMHEIFTDEVVFIDPNKYNYNLHNFPIRTSAKALTKYSWDKSAEILYKTIISKV